MRAVVGWIAKRGGILGLLSLGLFNAAAAGEPARRPGPTTQALELLAQGSPFGWDLRGGYAVRAGQGVVPTTASAEMPTILRYPAILPAGGEFQVVTVGPWQIEWLDPAGDVLANVSETPQSLNVVFWFPSQSGSKFYWLPRGDRPEVATAPRPESLRTLGLRLTARGPATLVRVAYFPPGGVPLWNGRDLSGWTIFQADPAKNRSTWTVTPEGDYQVRGGPGDLQTTRTYQDFLAHLEVRTAANDLNSGVFFRALPGQYQQGYEMQIRNSFEPGRRDRPIDFGTGAIYRRVPARRVVSSDQTWFRMDLLAVGPRIHTWVEGEPVVAWLDERPAAMNARQGRFLNPGVISLQGHDPTTDLRFRHFRLVDLAP